MADLVGAVDQGTTSSRFMIFDHDGKEVARHQLEHEQILPRAGWVEHDPAEIWENTSTCIGKAMQEQKLEASDLAALGITNQRETTVVWNRKTGEPYHLGGQGRGDQAEGGAHAVSVLRGWQDQMVAGQRRRPACRRRVR